METAHFSAPAAATALPASSAGASTAAVLPLRCGFLFNHDHLHQIAHSAPIAFELIRMAPEVQVILMAASQEQYDCLLRAASRYRLPRCDIRLLKLPFWLRLLQPLLDGIIPFTRVAMLLSHLSLFRKLDVLVVPEKTSLLLRTAFGLKKLKFIHTRHGAGDREIGFDRASGKFDFVLMSGQKIRDRLQTAGLLKPNAHAIVGYAKFDLHTIASGRPKLFNNDRPTVLYNPHCSPKLSSWYRDGQAVLEAFYQSDKYNLIFAPHVMLFKKKVQLSLEQMQLDMPGEIQARYRNCAHMLIDTGSERSCDMTYTHAADLYLGDASSQVYEFLFASRPCLFLNSHGVHWTDDDSYRHWNAGPVIADAQNLMAAVDAAFASHPNYAETQRSLFNYSFDLAETPSSVRGAEAILSFSRQQFPGRVLA